MNEQNDKLSYSGQRAVKEKIMRELAKDLPHHLIDRYPTSVKLVTTFDDGSTQILTLDMGAQT